MVAFVELYMQCRRFRALPRSGGIEDQSRSTMYVLNLIAATFEKHEARKLKEASRGRA